MITVSCNDCGARVELTDDEVAERAKVDIDGQGAPPIWCGVCLSSNEIPTRPVVKPTDTLPIESAAPQRIESERAVVRLVPPIEAAKNVGRAEIKAMLQELLARAEDGTLVGLAYATVSDRGAISCGWNSAQADLPLMQGSISLLAGRHTVHLLAEFDHDGPSVDG